MDSKKNISSDDISFAGILAPHILDEIVGRRRRGIDVVLVWLRP